MSTIRVSYLKHQASNTNTITIDANNLVTVTGNVISNTISDLKGEIRDVPINPQTATYSLTLADHGRTIAITTGGIFVPNAIFNTGDNIGIYNNSNTSQTITPNSSVVMFEAGNTGNGGAKTLAGRGLATVYCVGANTFVISGAGLT